MLFSLQSKYNVGSIIVHAKHDVPQHFYPIVHVQNWRLGLIFKLVSSFDQELNQVINRGQCNGAYI